MGNNNLFLNAQHIVGHDISFKDRFMFHDFSQNEPFRLTEEIDVVATAGHTAKCVSVVVRNCAEGTVVIAGEWLRPNRKTLQKFFVMHIVKLFRCAPRRFVRETGRCAG